MNKKNLILISLCFGSLTLSACCNSNNEELFMNLETTPMVSEVLETENNVEIEIQENIKEETTESEDINIQIINPWVECETIEQAEELAGFNFDSIKSAEINSIRYMKYDNYSIIEAKFYDGDNEIVIRKSNDLNDNSGDFRSYDIEETSNKDGIDIIYKGNIIDEENHYGLVYWINNDFNYSISCLNEIEKFIIDSYINVVFE